MTCPDAYRTVANPGRGPTAVPPAEMDAESELWLAATSEHEWLEEIRVALTTKNLDEAREWAKVLLAYEDGFQQQLRVLPQQLDRTATEVTP